MVAVGSEATRAARALARAVYQDAALRPGIDDAVARALVGDAPAGARDRAAAQQAAEIAELRAAVEGAVSDAAARRLLASLGADARAELVVVVRMEGGEGGERGADGERGERGRPVARVLRVATASYAPIELGATVEQPEAAGGAAAGEARFTWPGAVEALHGQQRAPRAGRAAVRPVAPEAAQTAAPARGQAERGAADADQGATPFWRSPWFWGSVGLAAAAGAAVFAISQAGDGEAETVHLRGRIAP